MNGIEHGSLTRILAFEKGQQEKSAKFIVPNLYSLETFFFRDNNKLLSPFFCSLMSIPPSPKIQTKNIDKKICFL